MKTKQIFVLIFVSLMAYCAGLCNASAFYDPGTQRWLNRDPLGESGGKNIFRFVGNNPIYNIDKYGLFVVEILDAIFATPTGGKTTLSCKLEGVEEYCPGSAPAQGPSARGCKYKCMTSGDEAPMTFTVKVIVGQGEHCPSGQAVTSNVESGAVALK